MIFQVTGLPRSGTGFVSTFLNLHPQCICFHDLAACCEDWRGMIEEINERSEFVGDVTTYGWLPKAQWTGPKVFIDRNPVEVVRSMNMVLDKSHDVGPYKSTHGLLQAWAAENEALVVPYEHLFTVDMLILIWEKVFGNVKVFPLEKAELLVKMNIQRHNPAEMLGSVDEARRRLF